MRPFCGAACSRLKERQLGLSAVWVAERGVGQSWPVDREGSFGCRGRMKNQKGRGDQPWLC